MLVTDLSMPIVLGKLAQLVPVVGMVLCGVPFLALGTLLGGIDPATVPRAAAGHARGGGPGVQPGADAADLGDEDDQVVPTTYAVWLVVILFPPTWFVLLRARAVPWPLPRWLEATSPVPLVFSSTLTSRGASLWEPARFLGRCLALSAALAGVAVWRLRVAGRREPVSEWR